MLDPRTKLLGGLDVASARGLEIGALHNPRFTKADGDIRYLDHATADDLRAKYAGDGNLAPDAHRIVEVDYVWRPGQRVADAVGGETFDYVIASHVIEHVPNPIGWLQQLSEVLKPGGLLALVVPDKRYCFDVNRGLSTAADLVDAHLRGLETPSFRNIYDHEVNYLPVDTAKLWAGELPAYSHRRDVADPDRFAMDCCLEQLATPTVYRDVHCHTFTPESFLGLLETLMRLGLLDYSVRSFFPTEVGHLEFFVTLERAREDTPSDQKMASVRARRAERASFSTVGAGGRRVIEVSPLEERLVSGKRALMSVVRRKRRQLKDAVGRLR